MSRFLTEAGMRERVTDGFVALGIGLVIAFQVAVFVVLIGVNTGVVREICLDERASMAAGRVEVDSGWTLILWPPFVFANIDPAGRCVRNSPLREGLSAVGVWKLPSPQEQVRQHIESQLGQAGQAGDGDRGWK